MDNRIIKLSPNESFGVKDCVGRIHGNLVLSNNPSESLCVSNSHIARSGPVALVIGDDLHFAMLENLNTRIDGAQINANGYSLFWHLACYLVRDHI